MYSHHSHSGQYVAHGVDPLDDILVRAVEMEFQLYCLTEHMPRIHEKYLYPEEQNLGKGSNTALEQLQVNFESFLKHAVEIKSRLKGSQTKIIIGTEIEGCDAEHIQYAKQLMEEHSDTIKFCVGSLHHINEIDIDYDQKSWNLALKSANNNIRTFLLNYFDQQYEMLKVLKPMVVGHFDLYKLFLPDNLKIDTKTGAVAMKDTEVAGDLETVSNVVLESLWDDVRNSITRNFKLIASYGGLIEINTSGLRKKLPEPYPSHYICQLAQEVGNAKFALSDDAHAVSHVAVCYREALDYISNVLKLPVLYHLEEVNGKIATISITIDELKQQKFWNNFDD